MAILRTCMNRITKRQDPASMVFLKHSANVTKLEFRALPQWTLCHNDWLHDGDGETCATWAAQPVLESAVPGAILT